MLMLSAVLLLALSFTSCSKDDNKKKNNPTNTFLGAWKRADSGPSKVYVIDFQKGGKATDIFIEYDSDGNIYDTFSITELEWTADETTLSLYDPITNTTSHWSYTVIDKDHIGISTGSSFTITRITDGEAKDLKESVKPENRIKGYWIEPSRRKAKVGSSWYYFQNALVIEESDYLRSIMLWFANETADKPFQYTNEFGHFNFDDDMFNYSMSYDTEQGQSNYMLKATALQLDAFFGTGNRYFGNGMFVRTTKDALSDYPSK